MTQRKWLITIAIIIGIFYTINSLILSVLNALNNVEWSTLSSQGKFTTSMIVVASWTNVMMAYLSTRASAIKKGEIPTNGNTTSPGNTEIITKQQTTNEVKTTS